MEVGDGIELASDGDGRHRRYGRGGRASPASTGEESCRSPPEEAGGRVTLARLSWGGANQGERWGLAGWGWEGKNIVKKLTYGPGSC